MFFDRSVSDQQRGWEWPLWSPNRNPLRVSNSRLYKTMYLLYILKFCGKHFGWFSSWLKACAGHGRKRWKILFGIWFLCWQLLLCLQPKKIESMAKKTDLWKRPSQVISNFKFFACLIRCSQHRYGVVSEPNMTFLWSFATNHYCFDHRMVSESIVAVCWKITPLLMSPRHSQSFRGRYEGIHFRVYSCETRYVKSFL